MPSQYTEHALINHFAIRCFRDTGDCDYIAARLASRACLSAQFLWSAEQAIEKYLKCILMLNRVSTKRLGHDIAKALARINENLPFQISLSGNQLALFNTISEWDADRYLLGFMHLQSNELLWLDALVWRLRQYCEPLDVIWHRDDPSESVLLENIERVESQQGGPASKGFLPGGLLEKILADKTHPSREALVWKNLRYSSRSRRAVRYRSRMHIVNPPLWLNPELADEAARWMQIPKEIIEECRLIARSREQSDVT